MRLLTFLLLTVFAGNGLVQAQNRIQRATNTEKLAPLDGNPTLFAVLAAINAAGYDTEIDSPTNNPLRKSLRDHLATRNIPILPALRRYVRDHHLPNPSDDLGQYISFALLSKGAPDFTPAMPNFPQPADADRLHDFAPFVAAFYQDADVAKLWELSQPAYDAALAEYTDGVSRAVQGVNSYLRNPQNPQTKGRFQVFVDLLGAPNQVHGRVYLEEYFVVITPSAEPRIDEVRHQYLLFWGDGLRFKYAADLTKLKPLGDYALASPILGEAYREDFLSLATECFIRAVDARITKRPAAVTQAMREGFVLTPAFADLLPKYETQADAMRDYFPTLVKGIDAKKEAVRLDKIDFLTERTVRTVRVTVPAKPPVLTGVAKSLEDAEELFRTQKLPAAKEAWLAIMAGTAEKPAQARAYYGLARVALSERDPERADQLFRKVLELEPDASTLSWSLVYLGKLADSQGEGDPAKEFYQQALAVAGLPEQVKREAQQGLTGAFFRPRPPEEQQ
ncbi:MAG: tetratricopeptide repeat protein [Bryobacteraceae bacterium]